MTKERDYLTLDEVEEYTGIKKNSLYYYLKTLGIKTHKFTLDKRAYISLEDANRIKEVKDTPWLAGEKPSIEAKKEPVSVGTSDYTHPPVQEPPLPSTERKKRAYTKQKEKKSTLPDGCILARHFAEKHGVKERTFVDHMLIGKGPGTVPGEQTDPMLPVKDHVDYSERVKPNRPKEKEKYLTSEQQHHALEFWKRHGVPFTECDQADCSCHTLKSGE